MKNAENAKTHSAKRGKPKHKNSRNQHLDTKFSVSLILLCAVFFGALVYFFVSSFNITFTQIGSPLEDGVYKITKDGENVFGIELDNDSSYMDRYEISFESTGVYTIRNVYTHLVLSETISSESDELEFEFLPEDDTCKQKFLMTLEDSGNRLISTCDTSKQGMLWQFESVEQTISLPTPTVQTIEDGIYAFVPYSNLQGILQIVDNGSLQIVEKNYSSNQLFELSYNDLGYYNIFSLELQAYMDILDDGNLLFNVEKRSYCGQDWVIVSDSESSKIISSCTGLALGALDGVNTGTNGFLDDVSALWQIERRRTVLFVGDSITNGQTSCNYNNGYCRVVAINAVETEMNILNSDEVNYIEINVGNSGATTNSYLSGMNEKYLNQIGQYRIEIAQIMLGTNDSARGVSVETYISNLSAIIDKLLGAGVKKVIINQPIYNAVAPWALERYNEALLGLANGETIFIGDTESYNWFKQNYWHLDGNGKGFHPDQDGYHALGQLWATAFQTIVEN